MLGCIDVQVHMKMVVQQVQNMSDGDLVFGAVVLITGRETVEFAPGNSEVIGMAWSRRTIITSGNGIFDSSELNFPRFYVCRKGGIHCLNLLVPR